MIIGTLLVVIILTTLVSLGYQKWWLVKYKYARWKLIRNQLEDFGESDKIFDVFVSYAGADQDFIDKLVPNMEPEYKLCLHERDFLIGRSITDNIVDFMAKSKFCLIILSSHYLQSEWCTFEAKVAQHIMKDKLQMIVLDTKEITEKSKSQAIKSLIKTQTFLIWNENDGKFWRRLDEALK